MTSANNFTIDGALAPADANATFDRLKDWLGSEGQGKLEIAPLPAFPELPTQPALQMLFAAIADFSDDAASRLHPDALALCRRLLGDNALEKIAKIQSLEVKNG